MAARKSSMYVDPVTGLKECSKCKQWLPPEAFYPLTQRPKALSSYCKACTKAVHSVWQKTRVVVQVSLATKECTVCKVVQPAEAFSKDARLSSGLSSRCKRCDEAKNARYRGLPGHDAAERRWRSSARGREVKRILEARRRASKLALPATYSLRDEQFALAYWGQACAVCGDRAGLWKVIALDHFIPVSSPECPGTVPGNMLPLCHARKGLRGTIPDCNVSKHRKSGEAWLLKKLGKRQAKKKFAAIQAFFAAAIVYAGDDEGAGAA